MIMTTMFPKGAKADFMMRIDCTVDALQCDFTTLHTTAGRGVNDALRI